MKALGMIEVYGYLTAVEALDCALKAANVSLCDVVKVKGGIVTVLVDGDVGAVKAAIDAAHAAAERVGQVISVHVIPRPAEEVIRMLDKAGLQYGPEAADETENETEAMDETETAEQTETTEETKNSDFSEEQLEAMTVVELRKLARDIEITNMTRQEIRFARKQELIHAILDFNINKGQEM